MVNFEATGEVREIYWSFFL